MKTQTQALDTLFHGKAIRLQSVYCFYIYVITSVSKHILLYVHLNKGKKRKEKGR